MYFSALYPGKMLLLVAALRLTKRSQMNLIREFDRWCSPVSMAVLSFFFHCSATSFARGSSGLGALNNAWIDSNTVRICRAGDHLSGRQEVQKKKRRGDKSTFRSNLSNQSNVSTIQHRAPCSWKMTAKEVQCSRTAIKSVEHCSSDWCGAKRLMCGEDLLIT